MDAGRLRSVETEIFPAASGGPAWLRLAMSWPVDHLRLQRLLAGEGQQALDQLHAAAGRLQGRRDELLTSASSGR